MKNKRYAVRILYSSPFTRKLWLFVNPRQVSWLSFSTNAFPPHLVRQWLRILVSHPSFSDNYRSGWQVIRCIRFG